MNATNPPDKLGGRRSVSRLVDRLVGRLVELSPKSEPISWRWAIAVGIVLLVIRDLLRAEGELGMIIVFLVAAGLAGLWCIKGWSGWLGLAGISVGILVVFLPFGGFDFLLMVPLAIVGWVYLRKLEAARKREAQSGSGHTAAVDRSDEQN